MTIILFHLHILLWENQSIACKAGLNICLTWGNASKLCCDVSCLQSKDYNGESQIQVNFVFNKVEILFNGKFKIFLYSEHTNIMCVL